MPRELAVDGRVISDETDCYVIAEIGHNHQGNLEQCKKLFEQAKQSGADAVKLQKRDNRALFTREMYESSYDNRNSYGPTYGTHREALEFGRYEYLELKAYASELGITFFSTAFDVPSVDFLADIDLPAYKIASGDLINLPLLRYVAGMQKPMFVSTGGGDMVDVVRAMEAILPINSKICLMQCTSGYPAEFNELNLNVIRTFRDRFADTVIGLSSHDNGIAMALVGYVLGARAIEKHFTLNRSAKGTDHAFSLTPEGLGRMIRDLRRARTSIGDGVKRRHNSEIAPMKKMGKKLVAARDLPAGQVLTADDITAKSPNDGLPPYEFDNVLGKTLSRSLTMDENINWNCLEGGDGK